MSTPPSDPRLVGRTLGPRQTKVSGAEERDGGSVFLPKKRL